MFDIVASATMAAPSGNLLVNGGFEDGLRGWATACAELRCGEVHVDSLTPHAGTQAAALTSTEEQWTAVRLRQQLPTLPGGPIVMVAWVGAGEDTWSDPAAAALEVQVELRFEDAAQALLGRCVATRTDLPSSGKFEPLRVSCTPPPGVRRTWAVVHFACIRGRATLLADEVSVIAADEVSVIAADEEPEDGRAAAAAADGTAVVSSALAPPVVPPIVHFIFGLSPGEGYCWARARARV